MILGLQMRMRQQLQIDRYSEATKKVTFPLVDWHRSKKPITAKLKRHLSYKEKRRLNLIKIKDKLNYEDFIPMHNMWISYITNVLNLKKTITNPEEMKSVLLKADYHGCRLLVSRAKNQSLVGVTGIVIREMKNCFMCITRENKIKTLPKQNSVFNFQIGDNLFTLYGNHFRVKTTDRKAKNFKSKPTIDL
uniref:Ribonuclease P protein subunit p29 n=1 Tax=Strigamia maritima TaxID=126957 RepID=T1J485_STRMM